MSNISNGYGGIKAIIRLLNPTYDATAIFQAFDNNAKYPDDKFVIMTQLPFREQMSLKPAQKYNAQNEIQIYEMTDSVWYQVDFYGTNAENYANSFKLFLTTTDCASFLNDNFSCTVHTVKEMLNLTNNLDRDKYKQRFMVKFSFFQNNIIAIPSIGFSSDTVGLILADVQGLT